MHKETGIIMSGEHPLKVLKGLKTMTRRTAGLQKINENPDDWNLTAVFLDGLARFYNTKTEEDITVKCPYGQVGDRLWVRETWQSYPDWEGDHLYYRADGEEYFIKGGEKIKIYWKPSIHMFKKDARIWLEITGLRVELRSDITLADAIAEGFGSTREFNDTFLKLNPKLKGADCWLWVISFKLLTERA